MADLLKLLADIRKAGGTDLHATSGDPVYVRRNGILDALADSRSTEDDVRKAILATSTPKAREILGKQRQVNYAWTSESGDRTRFSAYFSKGKFAFAARLLPAAPPKMADLGLPEPLRKVLAKQTGLIIVASASGQGKTTTIASLLEFINAHFEKNILTIENPVEIHFTDERSSFVQRGIPLDVPNFVEGLNEAYRLDPDVVMTDSLIYRDVQDQALFLCEAGSMVIGAYDGGNCQQILERLICGRPPEERDGFRGKLATYLSMIISQRLVPRQEGRGLVAVFDILVNTPQVRALIKNDNLVMIKTLQEQDQASGMQTSDRHLLALVKKNVVASQVAIAYADDAQEMGSRFTAVKGKG